MCLLEEGMGSVESRLDEVEGYETVEVESERKW